MLFKSFDNIKKTLRKFSFKNKKKILRLKKNNTSYGIVATQTGAVSLKQLKSCHYLLRRWLKSYGTYYFRAMPHEVLTKKPSNSRMGKGKGLPSYHQC